jgi:hypothetical protein
VAHSVERHRPSHSLSPAASELASALVPAGRDRRVEVPLNEQILNLVTTLSERVKQLESKLVYVEPRKRPTPTGQDDGQTIPSLTEYLRPAKKARVHQIEAARSLPATKSSEPEAEHNSSSGQNSSDAEAENAATVLEFLAWGRLKDNNLTSGVRDLTSAHDSTYLDKDVFQAAQTWSTLQPPFLAARYSWNLSKFHKFKSCYLIGRRFPRSSSIMLIGCCLYIVPFTFKVLRKSWISFIIMRMELST